MASSLNNRQQEFSHVNFPCSKCSRRHLIVHYNFIVKSAVFIADHFSGPARAMGLVCVSVYPSNNCLNKMTFDLCHQACWFTLTLYIWVKFEGQVHGHRRKILLKWSERPRVMLSSAHSQHVGDQFNSRKQTETVNASL